MINVLSYIGMNLHWEVCLWSLLGLIRTIFDATLFKVNSNLKQVWQMSMPEELSRPVQRVLRTMISGVMLVQCFTVYVYLATYIVLLYPIFLEERPTLVIPWLLLAAVRKLLCELTSLALGLGVCVLLGPARPPCIKFLITKLITITPAFYMWMLIYSYYNSLKLASAFKRFPAAIEPNVNDFGLELAVRRRRTKSLLREDELRKKIVADFNCDRQSSQENEQKTINPTFTTTVSFVAESDEESVKQEDVNPLCTTSDRILAHVSSYEDWPSIEAIPRGTDRILEQFVLMMLRISTYMTIEGHDPGQIQSSRMRFYKLDALQPTDTDTPPLIGSRKGKTASYLEEYPQIFMKKSPDVTSFPTFGSSTNDQVSTIDARTHISSILDDKSISNLDKKISFTKLIDEKNKQVVKKSSLRTIHSKDDSHTSTNGNNVHIKIASMVDAENEIAKSEIFTTNLDSLDKNSKEQTQDNNSEKFSDRNSKGQNNSVCSPMDSIERIIFKMRGILTQNNKSFDKDKSKNESSGPSSSRTNTAELQPRGGAHTPQARESKRVGTGAGTKETSTNTNGKSSENTSDASNESPK